METELKRKKKWFKREGQPHIAIAQICSHILLLLLLLLLLLYLFLLIDRVSTIMYLKQTMFLRYTVLQLFCIYSLCYM